MEAKALEIAKCFIPFPQAVGMINPRMVWGERGFKAHLVPPLSVGIVPLE